MPPLGVERLVSISQGEWTRPFKIGLKATLREIEWPEPKNQEEEKAIFSSEESIGSTPQPSSF